MEGFGLEVGGVIGERLWYDSCILVSLEENCFFFRVVFVRKRGIFRRGVERKEELSGNRD